ncbi:MAG: inositol monophosphatase family protein [Myxococcota bacterium]
MHLPRNQPIDPRSFVEAMSLPVRQAMAAVRWLEGRVANRPKASELTPEKAALTDGDCVSQEILLVALREQFPWVSLDVEEDTPSTRGFAQNRSRDRVVIDPIDGTLRYLLGDGPYAILVGLAREGRMEAALVGIPQRDLLIRAVRGQGAEQAWGDGPFVPAQLQTPTSHVLVSYGLPREIEERLRACGAKLTLAAGGVIGVAPLLTDVGGAVRISASSRGLSPRAWVSTLPTLEAGGLVQTLEGSFPDRYERGVSGMLVAPDGDVMRCLRSRIAP